MTTVDPAPAEPRAPVTVGVTGHRANRLAGMDLGALRSRVREVLERIRQAAGTRPLRMVSALAEGSDRIAAREAVRLGFELYGALPFGRKDYEKDFQTGASRQEFRELLKEASKVRQLPGSRETRDDIESAYAEVGRLLLEKSDVLLAIWDGEPARGKGGTAEVVREALAQDLPTIWIHLAPPHRASLLSRGDGEKPLEQDLERLTV